MNATAAELLGVHQTLSRYALALDQQDLVALESLLTEEATWTFVIAGRANLGPFSGRTTILDFAQAAMSTQSDQRRHHLTNVTLRSADANAAVAQAYLMLTSNAGGRPNLIATGLYTFTLRRIDDEWRIAELVLGMDNAE
ncbi:nuclear transport factor 2 family protein [Micromonospora sp. CPCC 205539]|uniref:nuclear transport factor 2 family protein n=1 Tax=Micromonospora sp. CPCC 205539 TaxID=3122408 RepID=UPI002FEFB2A8